MHDLRIDLVKPRAAQVAGSIPESDESPTLLQWFQMTRTVKSCPASECGQCPSLSDVDDAVDTTGTAGTTITTVTTDDAADESFSMFPTPDNSPRLKYDERTRLSSSAAPFQPKSSGANAVNPGTFYVPMGYMNMSQSHMSHSHMSHMNMGYQVNPWWDLPSVGSSQHGTGHCRPCAFLSRGCAKGQACTFCHLCGV
ncbi:unnamed protein product [Effrenium voratum]|nr:unnamed protein product [Effrenium voratum]